MSATQTFYLAFRRWCLLTRSPTARQCYHNSRDSTPTYHNTAIRGIKSGQQHHEALVTRVFTQPRSKAQAYGSKKLECVFRRALDHSNGIGIRSTLGRKSYSRHSGRLWTSRCYSQSHNATASEAPSLADSMRQALRTLTKPCVLVTSCTDIDDPKSYTGVTLSSFDAVTLHPLPQVSFNIRVPSRSYDVFKASKQICVHILSATPAGAAIADAFTRPYAGSYEPFELLKHAGAEVDRTAITPRIQFDGGVISWLLCERGDLSDMDVGDHKICLFVVRDVVEAPNVDIDTAQALAYGQKAFRSLGAQIDPQCLL